MRSITRSVFLLTIAALGSMLTAATGEGKLEAAGAPPQELSASVRELLAPAGTKVVDGSGKLIAEVWFRSSFPAGAANAEENVTFANLAHGTLMGAIRFPNAWSDRRGQPIKPGVYTLRFSMFPVNGDHQGVAPQRDFLLVLPAAADQDGKANLGWKDVTTASMKATGTPHPGVFSIWKIESDFKPGFAPMGEHDWVLQTKVGDVPLAMILIGKAEH